MSYEQDLERVLTQAEIEDELWWSEYLDAEDAWEEDLLRQAGGYEGVYDVDTGF